MKKNDGILILIFTFLITCGVIFIVVRSCASNIIVF